MRRLKIYELKRIESGAFGRSFSLHFYENEGTGSEAKSSEGTGSTGRYMYR